MDLTLPKCDWNDFPDAPDWAVCVINNGVHSAFCEEFDYMARAQWLGGREFRVSNPTNFTVIASRNEPRKPEWNGEGLPPVGCRVEVKADDFEGGWLVIDVVYVHNGEVVGIVQSENEYLNDRLEKFSAGYNRAEFRPVRSEADKKRDESAKGLIEYLDKETDIDNVFSIKDVIGFYDAIAAGKIPHIRID